MSKSTNAAPVLLLRLAFAVGVGVSVPRATSVGSLSYPNRFVRGGAIYLTGFQLQTSYSKVSHPYTVAMCSIGTGDAVDIRGSAVHGADGARTRITRGVASHSVLPPANAAAKVLMAEPAEDHMQRTGIHGGLQVYVA